MKSDHLTIKHVDNGYVLELNTYATDRRRSHYVARTEDELYALVRQLFPPAESKSDAIKRDICEKWNSIYGEK